MSEKRRGAFGLWCFVFSMILVLFEARGLKPGHSGFPFLFGRGSLAAEFFFVSAGCLLAERVDGLSGEPFDWRESWSYIKARIASFYPAFLMSWAVTFTALAIVFFEDIVKLRNDFLSSVLELTLLRNAGLSGCRALPQTWLLSALVIALFILYPLYRSNKKRFEYFIAPVAAILLLGYLYYKTGTLNDTSMFMTFSFKSTYRAIGEVCLGVVCYRLSALIGESRLSRAKESLLSLAALAGYGFAIFYMQFPGHFPKYFDYIALLTIAAGVTVTFSGRGALGRLFERKLFVFLGRFSLYPFLMCILFVKLIPELLPKLGEAKAELLYLALTLLSAAALMLIDTALRKARKKAK